MQVGFLAEFLECFRISQSSIDEWQEEDECSKDKNPMGSLVAVQRQWIKCVDISARTRSVSAIKHPHGILKSGDQEED